MKNEITEGVRDFILGGKAEFTIFQEPCIQVKYIVKANDNKTCWFVSTEMMNNVPLTSDVLVSGRNLIYQGYLKRDLSFNIGNKGVQNYNKMAINGLLWVLSRGDNLPSKVHIFHHGKCSVCGRKLTDSKSLSCGIGPTCRKNLFK